MLQATSCHFCVLVDVVQRITIVHNSFLILQFDGFGQLEVFHSDMFDNLRTIREGEFTPRPGTDEWFSFEMNALVDGQLRISQKSLTTARVGTGPSFGTPGQAMLVELMIFNFVASGGLEVASLLAALEFAFLVVHIIVN